MGSSRPAVFLDRDGTLMEEVHYCNDPANVRAIPGAAAALRRLGEAGFLNVIVTNQSGLASGKISLEQYRAVEAELNRQLEGRVDAVYFCADSSSAPTRRRKPGVGMLLEAEADLGIALACSWMVGDKEIDVVCGSSAGCRTILVQTGYGGGVTATRADFTVPTIVEAADLILTHTLS